MGWGTFTERLSGVRGAWTQLHQIWRVHRVIIPTHEIGFRVRIFCCIFKRVQLKVERCFKRRQISHFLTPCENWGWVGKISILIVKALPTTESPTYIWWPSTNLIQSFITSQAIRYKCSRSYFKGQRSRSRRKVLHQQQWRAVIRR